MKHLPLGSTNPQDFKRPGFRIGFAGISNPAMSSELPKGSSGSIMAEGTSDLTKFGTFLARVESSTAEVVASALGLIGDGCFGSHKSLTLTSSLWPTDTGRTGGREVARNKDGLPVPDTTHGPGLMAVL